MKNHFRRVQTYMLPPRVRSWYILFAIAKNLTHGMSDLKAYITWKKINFLNNKTFKIYPSVWMKHIVNLQKIE